MAAFSTMGEKTSFLGTRILPQSMKIFSEHIKNISKNAFRLLIQLAVNTLEDRPIADGALNKIQSQIGQVEHIEELFAVIYFLMSTFLWLPPGTVKVESFKEELRELKLNEECITDLASVLYGPKRQNLDNILTLREPHLPRISSLTWRLDIIISSSCVSRVLEHSIMFKLHVSTGQTYIFHVPISKFHQFRHQVAMILSDMTALEQRSFFKA
ncbi:hypothetical protein B566_EDAN012384 [Ephemera danica]|nr:hypothetical protein B566_EDAN012384 [Ephemera danica]